MDDFKLIYVLDVGQNYKGEAIYEFLFSDTTNNVEGEDWDVYPASGKPTPPRRSIIKAVGSLLTELKLDVIQNSDTFSVYDATDGVIALAWENINDYDEYPKIRLVFRFGDTLSNVREKLNSKKIILDIKDVKQ